MPYSSGTLLGNEQALDEVAAILVLIANRIGEQLDDLEKNGFEDDEQGVTGALFCAVAVAGSVKQPEMVMAGVEKAILRDYRQRTIAWLLSAHKIPAKLKGELMRSVGDAYDKLIRWAPL